jgi:predicted dehydrogenase|tara:strand:+ start:1071 stop:2126 length:1056 start_codon:yes stop_codon:yes gene_type:complete
MKEKVNIAVIGAGWWCTDFYLPYLSSLRDVNLYSVCRYGKKELELVKKKYKFKFSSENYKESLSYEELDGAIISTPHSEHFVCAKEALEKKLHVVIEKPMTTSSNEAKELFLLSKKNKRQIIIPYGYNYTHFMDKARKYIVEGIIGEIRHIDASMSSSTLDLFGGEGLIEAKDHTFQPLASTWSDPNKGGGYAWGQTSHLIGAIFKLVEATPEKLVCFHLESQTKVDYTNAVSLMFKEGITASISGCAYLPKNKEEHIEIKIHGTKGAIFLDIEPSRERLTAKIDGKNIEHDMNGEGAQTYSMNPVIDALVSACKGKIINHRSDETNGYKSVQVLDAMYRSMQSNKVEEVY